MKGNKKLDLSMFVASSENIVDHHEKKLDKNTLDVGYARKSIYSTSQKPKAPLANLTLNPKNETPQLKANESPKLKLSNLVELTTTKLMLKDLRIPLVWKWNEHLKAVKNPGNFLIENFG